jgi:hypothetical protein
MHETLRVYRNARTPKPQLRHLIEKLPTPFARTDAFRCWRCRTTRSALVHSGLGLEEAVRVLAYNLAKVKQRAK